MTTVQKTVDISGSQMSVQELLHLVGEGTEILLTDGNNPLARLVPISQQNVPRIAGLHQGEIWTSNDFDAPLPEEFWTLVAQANVENAVLVSGDPIVAQYPVNVNW